VGLLEGEREYVIDHLVIGPSGVYVIAADAEASSLATHAVAGLLQPRYRTRVRPVCVQPDTSSVDDVDGVTITSYPILEHIVRSSPVVLSTSEVKEVAGRLAAGLQQLPAPGSRRRVTWRRLLAASAAAAAVALGGTVVGPDVLGLLGGR